jgi:hypothetical protein
VNMIRYSETTAVAVQAEVGTLPALVKRAAASLSNATSAAEILEAKEMASLAYDAAKKTARFAKAKQAHDEVISAVYRAQADALEIESMAKRRLADEYDAAQDRGEIRKNGDKSFSGKEKLSGPEVIPPKELHEARQVRDAEKTEPGIVKRVLDEKVSAGQEPTKAALREAVVEAAKQGLAGSPSTPPNKNPLYKAPSKSGSAWTYLYGECRALNEWATDEHVLLALHGMAERTDDQSANINAIRKSAEILNTFLESINAQ